MSERGIRKKGRLHESKTHEIREPAKKFLWKIHGEEKILGQFGVL